MGVDLTPRALDLASQPEKYAKLLLYIDLGGESTLERAVVEPRQFHTQISRPQQCQSTLDTPPSVKKKKISRPR